MSRSYELDRLKAEQDAAFQRKQEAYQNYKCAKESTDIAHDVMQRAWDERVRAREKMNEAFEQRKESFEHHDSVWGEYARIRDYNNSQIESLKYDADYEHRAMQDCFDRASDAYTYGNKSEAPILSQEGHEHKERRDELNAEISRLANEVKSAKASAEMRAPKVDSSSFESAKAEFERLKEIHESAQTEFKNQKAERDRLKCIFDALQEEHMRCQKAFQNRLALIKSDNQRERDTILDKAGIAYYEREDAKIVQKNDGTTQIYHGGVGGGDGLGHGHTAIDNNGNVTYARGAFEEHGGENYVESRLAIGTDYFDGKPAKVRQKPGKPEGWRDVFFVNSGNIGDDIGHGHIVLDPDNNVHYYRDVWQEHRDENGRRDDFLIDEDADIKNKVILIEYNI